MKMMSIMVKLALVAAMLLKVAMATNFTVGSPVFQYTPQHTVLEVTKAAYDACQTSNAILTDTGGNSVVPLTKPGKRYFICGTPGHCTGGMKMDVNVLAASSPATPAAPAPAPSGKTPSKSPTAPSTSPAAADSPSESTSPSPTSTSSASPPSPSTSAAGKRGFRPAVAVSFVFGLIVFLAF